MGKRKTPVDLGALADEANQALNFLVDEGYEKEVQKVRTFLIEQGEAWKKERRLQHQVAGKLARDLRIKRGEDPDADSQ